MKFCHVTLSVKNMDDSLRFYQEIVRLPLRVRFPVGSGTEIAFLGSGETEIELICSDAYTPQDRAIIGVGISLGFVTESLDATIAFVREKGYETDGIIQSPNPSVSFFFAKDPDGYTIQFVKNNS